MTYCAFFSIQSRFRLRGCKEHFDLDHFPDSQINMIKGNSRHALIYKEFRSKTYNSGVKKEGSRNKFCFLFRLQTLLFVELHHKYMWWTLVTKSLDLDWEESPPLHANCDYWIALYPLDLNPSMGSIMPVPFTTP